MYCRMNQLKRRKYPHDKRIQSPEKTWIANDFSKL